MMTSRRLCFVVVSVFSLWFGLSLGQTAAPIQNTLLLNGTLHDQAPATMNHSRYEPDWWMYNGWINNPTMGGCGTANNSFGFTLSDFELPLWWYGDIRTPNAPGGVLTNGEPGVVGNCCNASNSWTNCGRLGSDRTPVYQFSGHSPYYSIQSPLSFNDWFHSTPQTKDKPITLSLDLIQGRTYGYTNVYFFPFDNDGWNDWNLGESGPGVYHNYGYTLELHASFFYQGGETFYFQGDDDVWVFLDNRLMIDLGGVHTDLSASISLDDIGGLTLGGLYNFDFFYAERHSTASKLQMSTSIGIICSYYDWCQQCQGNGQSCCTQADKDACAENNQCYTGTCAVTVPPAVGCVYTTVTCNDNNVCTTDVCVNSTGCTYTDISCDDNNVCTDDSCDPTTGCSHVPVPCTGDMCNLPSCNITTGCLTTPVVCNDNDACTTDSCDPSTGCSFVTKNCNDNNACTTDSCDIVLGCQNIPINCNDTNPCTDDSCSMTAGCVHVQKTCDDSNVCTADSCDPSNQPDGCVNTPISSCNPTTGPCSISVCNTTDVCNPRSCDVNGNCVTKAVVCNDNNLCTDDSCSNTGPTAQCVFAPVNCSQANPCNPQSCDQSSGTCVGNPVVCNDGNFCTNDSCVVSGGKASCSFTPISCSGYNTKDLCTPAVCNASIGCVPGTSICNDHNPCTTDTCVGYMNCSYTLADACTDNDPCTNDICNSNSDSLATACSHTNVTCTPPTICQIATGCESSKNGCVFEPKPCPPSTDFCTNIVCDNSAGCIPVPKVCLVNDADCYVGVCNSATASCTSQQRPNFATLTSSKGNGQTCYALYEQVKTAAIITGGILAAIIVGAVIFAALAALAARKAYLYMQLRNANTSGVSNNPLYTPSGGAGDNPLFKA
jgi:fibro-slime domain-containing protein